MIQNITYNILKKISVFVALTLQVTAVLAQTPKLMSLNGAWKFITDQKAFGQQSSFLKTIPKTARTVTVPHTWNIEKGLENYAGKAWYFKTMQLPAEWKSKAVFIRFEAVYHDAVVYVNGKEAGRHLNSGYTPFAIDVSSFLKYGQPNILTVSCDNSFSDTNLPYQKAFDWANDGGIIRDVSLYVCERPSIKYVHVTPLLNLKDSSASAWVTLKLNEAEISSVNVDVRMSERKSGRMIFQERGNLQSNNGAYRLMMKINKVTPWHFDNPFLYDIKVVLRNKQQITDSQVERIGFRKVYLDGEHLVLNGEQVRLPGIEYMPGSNPANGSAEPKSTMDRVVKMMKQLNVVITRFHWQQDPYMLNLMDEQGILVQEEIPWWQKPAQLGTEVLATAKQQLTEMIDAHYNHPSIVAWALNNEVPSTKQDNNELHNFTLKLDSTRLINVVGNKMDMKLEKDPGLMGDLPSWNDYVGTWNGNNRDALPQKLENIHKVLDGRPLMISEAGLCEPAFSGGDARRIDDMTYHINEWRGKPFITGFIYFCLNDYRTQMGEEGKGKFQIRRHGIADIYLQPKPSFYTFAQLCSPLEVTKVNRINGNDIAVEIKVKNSIPSYTIKNYVLEYSDDHGHVHQNLINSLKPGDTRQFTIKNINERYSFILKRPGGTVVASY